MKERGWGRIVNMASVAGTLGGFGQASLLDDEGGPPRPDADARARGRPARDHVQRDRPGDHRHRGVRHGQPGDERADGQADGDAPRPASRRRSRTRSPSSAPTSPRTSPASGSSSPAASSSSSSRRLLRRRSRSRRVRASRREDPPEQALTSLNARLRPRTRGYTGLLGRPGQSRHARRRSRTDGSCCSGRGRGRRDRARRRSCSASRSPARPRELPPASRSQASPSAD